MHIPPCSVLVEIEPVACLVDDTAADESSDSDADAEGGRSGRVWHGALSGCMPGWIGRLQRREHAPNCSSLASPGRLCRAHAGLEGGTPTAEHLSRAAAALRESLAAAQLDGTDIVSVKAYCPAALLSEGRLSTVELRRCLGDALGAAGAAAAVVPVTAIGSDGGCPASLHLEMLALRHP